ncbi:unnamed protein product, partial [marine sediment metagenome]
MDIFFKVLAGVFFLVLFYFLLSATYYRLKAFRTGDEEARGKMTKAWDMLNELTRRPRLPFEPDFEPGDVGPTVEI